MNSLERHAMLALGSIMALRMIGLFMILPVFALYAEQLANTSPVLIGLAIGAYGLSQALLQIPFGLLSDRFGRKVMITIGLLMFTLGSFIAAYAAYSDSLLGIIIGRALQGSGAISAVLMAFMSDLVREQHRTKAMASIGMAIGLSFVVSLILGPIVNNWIGIQGIFMLIGVLALLAIVFLHGLLPNVPTIALSHLSVRDQLSTVLKQAQLLRLDASIFILHAQLTALFLIFPLSLVKQGGLPATEHWWVYLGVLIPALMIMVPFIIIAEKRQRMKSILVGSIPLLVAVHLGFAGLEHNLISLMILLTLFFAAFNLAEALLPSWISKIAPSDSKGTAMGIYASAQFLGAFVGGLGGGWLHQQGGASWVFMATMAISLIWLWIAWGLKQPIKKKL